MKPFFPVAIYTFLLGTVAAQPAMSLAELVGEITAGNPELRFFEAEIAAAKAGRKSATLRPDPEVSLDLGRKRVREPGGALAGEGTAWSVSVLQSFEWPGRLALRKTIANHQVELAELGLARFRAALSARAQTLSFSLHAANAKADAAREVAERLAELKETFLARDPAGITPQLETRVIEASELVHQRRARDAELAVQNSLLQLNQLRDKPADTPLHVVAPRLVFNAAPSNAELLPAARENNFDLRVKRAEVEQQGFEVRLARHERYPRVDVRPFYSRENADQTETTVGLGVSVPLPLSGRSRGGIEAAEARRRQAEAALAVAHREIEREVLIAAQAFAVKVAEIRSRPSDAVTKFREAAALADRHYRLGAVPVATYVELQTSYLDAVDALLDTEQEALEAGLRLEQLTGLNFKPAVPADSR